MSDIQLKIKQIIISLYLRKIHTMTFARPKDVKKNGKVGITYKISLLSINNHNDWIEFQSENIYIAFTCL